MPSPHPTRRDLLAAGLSAAGGIAALPSRSPAADPAPASAGPTDLPRRPDTTLPACLKTSLAGYTYREELDRPGQPGKMSLFDLVDVAARLGCDGVEPTSYYFLKTDPAFLHALKRYAFLAGLDVSGTPIRNDFCLPPGAALDAELAHVRTWAEHCARLGSPVMRIFAGKKHDGQSRDEAFRRAVEGIKRACDESGSRGVMLALENHGYLTETADDLLPFVEGVNHDWFGINLDTGNFRDDPYASITRAAPHAVVCQLKANVRNSGTGQQEPADIPRIVRILREAKYRGHVALEYEGRQPHERVPILMRQLQQAIRETR